MEELHAILSQFGLNQTEADVYLAALAHPHVSPRELADDTSYQRTNIYHAIASLEEKGLIRRISKTKKTRYIAESPEQLNVLLQRKKLSIKHLKKQLDEALPFFPTAQESSISVPHVEYFTGVEGIKNVSERILQSTSKELFAINPPFKKIEDVIDSVYGTDYLMRRAKAGIHTKSIWQDMPAHEPYADSEALQREVRLAPPDMRGETEALIEIFDNTVIILNFLPEMYALLIKSHTYTKTMKAMWQHIWDNSEPV